MLFKLFWKIYFKFRIVIQNQDYLKITLHAFCFEIFSSNVFDSQPVDLFETCFWFCNRFLKCGWSFCVCGEWSSKETFQWEFYVDKNMTACFIHLEEELKYEDLLNMVSYTRASYNFERWNFLGGENYGWRCSLNLHRKYSATNIFTSLVLGKDLCKKVHSFYFLETHSKSTTSFPR